MFKKNGKSEPKDEEKSRRVRELGFGVISGVAGTCVGLVVKAGLEMITPPSVEPIMEIGYKVGKWVVSGLAITMAERAINSEITEYYEGFAETFRVLKANGEAVQEQ